MLQDTAIRDLDQVVSRYAKNNPDIGKDDHNILMVDQLWIWYIKGKKGSQEPDTVITCFPNRQGAKVKNSRDLDDLWFQVLANKIHQSRGVISSAADLIARVIEVCSGTLNRHQHVEKLQFVQMFEATIGDAVSYFILFLFFEIRSNIPTIGRPRDSDVTTISTHSETTPEFE